MKHELKSIMLTCDGCGKDFEFGQDMVCYADDEDGRLVEQTAKDSDWKILGDHHYCPDCWEYDDDDFVLTKDGRKWDDSGIEAVEVEKQIHKSGKLQT